jgi:tRNA pseudouridine55 synthase
VNVVPDMDGVLVIDKPQGITSHDVVAAARRALGESRIGHTGTLDPLATGVLPLACGRATRLVRFMAAADKEYEATLRFGLTTDSYDITGAETSRSNLEPTADAVAGALVSLRGEYLQMPPAYSAKKVGGRRAYELARRNVEVTLTAVPVRVARAELLAFTGATATVAITCSAGFYVRSLAHTVGERTGTGACLEALRRTRSGEFVLGQAVTLDVLMANLRQGGEVSSAAGAMVPLDRLLSALPSVSVTDEGRRRIVHGRDLDAEHVHGPAANRVTPGTWVKLLDEAGHLLALATPAQAPAALHPSLVLI